MRYISKLGIPERSTNKCAIHIPLQGLQCKGSGKVLFMQVFGVETSRLSSSEERKRAEIGSHRRTYWKQLFFSNQTVNSCFIYKPHFPLIWSNPTAVATPSPHQNAESHSSRRSRKKKKKKKKKTVNEENQQYIQPLRLSADVNTLRNAQVVAIAVREELMRPDRMKGKIF